MTKLFARSLLFALVLASCNSPTENSVRSRAIIATGDAKLAIESPDTVQSGVPFTVTVYAWGSGTRACNEPDGTEVSRASALLRIEGFVRHLRSAQICTDDLRRYPLPVTALFSEPGNVTIRYVGSRYDIEGVLHLDSLHRTIVVR